MARKTTVKKINLDSAQSEMTRMAAGYINESRKKNGHINVALAVAKMATSYGIENGEARHYVESVIDLANDMEWNG